MNSFALLNRARELLVWGVEDLLALFNAEEHLRPYMSLYPFDENNVEVGILFLIKAKHVLNHLILRQYITHWTKCIIP